jgi:hypothetical protein
MRVYLNGSKERTQARYSLLVAPAASGFIAPDEIPEWMMQGNLVDDEMIPRTFEVVFQFGQAEIDDRLAAWLIFHGVVSKRNAHPIERAKRVSEALQQAITT